MKSGEELQKRCQAMADSSAPTSKTGQVNAAVNAFFAGRAEYEKKKQKALLDKGLWEFNVHGMVDVLEDGNGKVQVG